MNCRRAVATPLLLLSLAGCGALQNIEKRDEPARVEDVRSSITEPGKALAYFARVRGLSAPERAREQGAARLALGRSRTDSNRVRYALALVAGGPAVGDDTRAVELLEPVARNDDSKLHGLALLLLTFLHEQNRLDGQVQGLQKKLDALLNLERNMTGRDSAGAQKR